MGKKPLYKLMAEGHGEWSSYTVFVIYGAEKASLK
jgi:hypothetical protein